MAFKKEFSNSISYPQEKKQRILLVILVLTLLGIIFTVYFGFFRSSSVGPTGDDVSDNATTSSQEVAGTNPDDGLSEAGSDQTTGKTGDILKVEKVSKVQIDKEFFNKDVFQNLKSYGEWPLTIGQQGKDNLFASYNEEPKSTSPTEE